MGVFFGGGAGMPALGAGDKAHVRIALFQNAQIA